MAAEEHGRLHIYMGDGKGKTTSAIGLSIRMLGSGRTVALIQFDKGSEETEFYSERHILRTLPGLFLHPTGCQRFNPQSGTFRFGVTAADREEGARGLALVRAFIERAEVGMVVADELCSSIGSGIVDEAAVLALIDVWEERGRQMELVLTGRDPSPRLLARADLISEVKKIRHYYDQGQRARRGIEY